MVYIPYRENDLKEKIMNQYVKKTIKSIVMFIHLQPIHYYNQII